MARSKLQLKWKARNTRQTWFPLIVGHSKQVKIQPATIQFPGPKRLLSLISKAPGLVCGIVLGGLTFWLAYITWQDGHCSTELANWTAHKDFFEHCSLV